MRQTGLDAARDVAAALGDIRTRMAEIQTLAAAGGIERLFGAIGGFTSGIVSNIPLLGQWLVQLGSIPVIGQGVIAVIAALAVSLAVTLGLALGGSLVILAAWTAGLLAMGLALSLALGPLGLIAGGIILLADRLFTTGKVGTDPLLGLEQALGKMADTWGVKAFPMATQMIDWATKLVPVVTQAGLSLLDWFGQRLPTIMADANKALGPIGQWFLDTGKTIGGFVDQVLQRLPSMAPIFGELGKMSQEAIKGLLDNLIRFVDWFIKNWPTIEPIAKQVLSQVGSFIQWLGKEAEKLVDWFVKNWPQIQKTMEDLKPILQALPPLFSAVGAVIDTLTKPLQTVVGLWQALNGAMGSTPSRPMPTPGPNPGGGGGGGGGGAFGFSAQGGGMVPGTGPQAIIAHGGEMILNPDQLGAIIGLLASIDRKLSTGFSTRAYASRA